MNRDIKFRAWDSVQNIMIKSFDGEYKIFVSEEDGNVFCGGYMQNGDWNEPLLMQYTGLKDKNGQEIYEGDIRREEVEHDYGDEVEYFVCVWIKEWTMFAWLNAPGEYNDYIEDAVEHLDSTMFWSFPVQADKNPDAIQICGNIYENPELIK